MKFILNKYWFLVCLLTFSASKIKADHLPGANLTYENVGPNTYVFTLTIFRDCDGVNLSDSPKQILAQNSCGNSSLSSFFLPNIVYEQEVSQLCPSELPNSSCNGGPLPGIQLNVFRDTITLPIACDTWEFSHSFCCRNDLVNNGSSFAGDLIISTTLNSVTAPDNNSPVVSTELIPYICVGQPLVYNLGIYDVDGDSLNYSLIEANLTGSGFVYAAGYSGSAPIQGITINSLTGDMSFTPNTMGNFVVVVMVEEYNAAGELKGTMVHDFQFTVINCDVNFNPVEPNGVINFTGGGTLESPSNISACIFENFCFDVEFTDANANDSIFITSNVSQLFPNSTVTQLTWTSPAVARVCCNVSSNSIGDNQLVFTAKDNSCPLYAVTFFPVTVHVNGGTYAGTDETICYGDSVMLNGLGGVSPLWSSIIGGDPLTLGSNFSCDTCYMPFAKPDSTTSYILALDSINGCRAKDTITVNVVSDIAYALSEINYIVCTGQNIPLGVLPPDTGSYTYEWAPSDFLDNANAQYPFMTPESPGTYEYSVSLFGSNGCTKHDTITFDVDSLVFASYELTEDSLGYVCRDTSSLGLELLPNTNNLECGLGNFLDSCVTSYSTLPAQSGLNGFSTGAIPFDGDNLSNKVQYLFLASELNAWGVKKGRITEISWEVLGIHPVATDSTFKNFSLKIGCHSGIIGFPTFISGLEEVYSPRDFTATMGWNTIVFDQPYNWDGVSGIAIEICTENLNGTSFHNLRSAYEYTSNFLCAYHNSDTSEACLYNGNPSRTHNRILTRFTSCEILADLDDYSIDWSPQSFFLDPNSVNPGFLPNQDTTITMILTHLGSGCSDTVAIDVNVNCCDNPFIAVTSPTCNDGSDASILATPNSDDSGPWTIQLLDPISLTILDSNSNIQTNHLFTGLNSGTYLISSLDNNGCYADTLVEIINTPPISVNAGMDSVICLNDSIELNASGGNIYSWESNPFISDTSIHNPYFVGDTTTKLVVVITDNNGCSNTDSVTIEVFDLPVVSAGNDVWLCTGFDTQLFATGGIQYSWTPNLFISDSTIYNPIVSPLDTMVYVVFGTDANTCVNTDSVTIFANGIVPTNAGDSSIICFGDSLELGSQPTSTAGSTYSWTPVSLMIDNSVSNPVVFPLVDTWFTLITNNDTCSGQDSVFVKVNSLPNVNAGPDIEMCINDSIELNVGGANSYKWTPSTSLTNDSISNPISFANVNIIYIVTGTDVNGCQNMDTLINIVYDLPEVGLTSDTTSCRNVPFQLESPDYFSSYVWSPSSNLNDNAIYNPITVLDSSFSYYLEVIDSNNCRNNDTMKIDVFRISINGSDTAICINDTVIVQSEIITNAQYSWTPLATSGTPFSSSTSAWPLGDTYYALEVIDSNNCVDKDSILISVYNLPTIDYLILEEYNCDNYIVSFISQEEQSSEYDWYLNSNPYAQTSDTLFVLNYYSSIEVGLEITDVNSCKVFYDTLISSKDFDLLLPDYLPNVFTPNNDGENDNFIINFEGDFTDCIDFSIFNRWGQMVFTSFGNVISWDGKTSDGVDVSEGVYFYQLDINGRKYKGSLSLFR